jgi:hypothetical protein
MAQNLKKTLSLGSTQILLPINQNNEINFNCMFKLTCSLPQQRFKVAITNQHDLDEGEFVFKEFTGKASGSIRIDNNEFSNHYIVLKADEVCEVESELIFEQLPDKIVKENFTQQSDLMNQQQPHSQTQPQQSNLQEEQMQQQQMQQQQQQQQQQEEQMRMQQQQMQQEEQMRRQQQQQMEEQERMRQQEMARQQEMNSVNKQEPKKKTFMDYLKSDMYIWILLGLGVLIVGYYIYKCFFKDNKKNKKGSNDSSKSSNSTAKSTPSSTPKSTPSQTPQIKASFPEPSNGSSSSSSKKKNKLLDKMRKHKN